MRIDTAPEIINPEDLLAPATPDEATGQLGVRNKMPGVVRFSARSRYLMYALVFLLGLVLAYGIGVFGTGSKNTDKSLTVLSQPTPMAQQVPTPPADSALDRVTKDAPDGVVLGHGKMPPLNIRQNRSQLAGQMNQAGTQNAQSQFSSALAQAQDSPSTPEVHVPPPQTVPNAGEYTVPSFVQRQTPEQSVVPTAIATKPAIFVGTDNRGQQGSVNSSAANDLQQATSQAIAQSAQQNVQAVVPATTTTQASSAPALQTGANMSQIQRVAYANQDEKRPPYLNEVQHDPAGGLELWAGSVIPAELDTGVNADIPGTIVGHVTRDVYDSRTGRALVIPKGSRLIGRYNPMVTNGQHRVQAVWDRLIWPDGRYLNLNGMNATDDTGNAGLYADVNDHHGALVTATILTGLLAAGSDILTGGANLLLASGQPVVLTNKQILYNDVGQQAAQTGQAVVRKQVDIPPELTVPAGETFNVLLDRSIVLPKWEYKQ